MQTFRLAVANDDNAGIGFDRDRGNRKSIGIFAVRQIPSFRGNRLGSPVVDLHGIRDRPVIGNAALVDQDFRHDKRSVLVDPGTQECRDALFSVGESGRRSARGEITVLVPKQ